MAQSSEAYVRHLFERSIALKRRVADEQAATIVRMAEIAADAIHAGGKLLLCGNGGSAADAQHFAAELLVRLRPHVNRPPLPAISLNFDMSSVTACANDYSFEEYWERLIQAVGNPGDVLIAISTSGRSPNIVRALIAARAKGITTLGLLGGEGAPALQECDLALLVPASETGRVQEAHITIGHALLELVEEMWLARQSTPVPLI
ncbi:MAG: SIS domain-containing protein [Vicinamibacterales bacterium]